MPEIVFAEYRDEYAGTSYPFEDMATLTDITNTLTLPVGLFIDASFYLTNESASIYLEAIEVAPGNVTITVKDTDGLRTATGNANSASSLIYFYDKYGRQVGVLVSRTNVNEYFSSLQAGTYTFTQKATTFSVRCIVPLLSNGVSCINIRDTQKYLSGDVWLIGRDGVILRTEEVPDADTTCIRVDIVGDPLFKTAACANTNYKTPKVVQTINNASADEYGNFIITTAPLENILRVNTTSNGIVISLAGASND